MQTAATCISLLTGSRSLEDSLICAVHPIMFASAGVTEQSRKRKKSGSVPNLDANIRSRQNKCAQWKGG